MHARTRARAHKSADAHVRADTHARMHTFCLSIYLSIYLSISLSLYKYIYIYIYIYTCSKRLRRRYVMRGAQHEGEESGPTERNRPDKVETRERSVRTAKDRNTCTHAHKHVKTVIHTHFVIQNKAHKKAYNTIQVILQY